MLPKKFLGLTGLVFLLFFLTNQGFTQEDKIGQVAIETVRAQMRFPKEIGVKFLERKESPIPGFYSVKLLIVFPNRETPMVVYVAEGGEKVIIGSLFIKGENVTRKEAGEPKPRKIDMGQLEVEKSPFKGAGGAKVTIVEFSNFQCSYCLSSSVKIKELLEKYPKDLKYVFKHFPFQLQGKPFELSEMAAAAQEVSPEAFWTVHDFLFSNEGQTFAKLEKEGVKQKVEQILKEKGYDVKAFQTALEAGKGKKRVEEDVAVGKKIQVIATPTTIVNGDFMRGGITDKSLERYLGK